MQFKTFTLSALLLALPETVFATPEGVPYVKALEVSGNSVSLNFQSQDLAESVEGKSLAKRQTCLGGSTPCYEGCCELFHLCYCCCAFSVEVLTTVPGRAGTVCGIWGGEKGCCPVGKTCNGVNGCTNPSDVYCTTYCCPSGSTCGPSKTCKKEIDGDRQCDAGYSLCAEFDGCCPNGVRCILPKNCAIPCAADDPKCGNGCCEKGFYCTKDEKCARLNKYTSLEGPTITRPIYTRTIPSKTDYPTETLVDTTTTPDSTTDSTTDLETDSTPTETESSPTSPTSTYLPSISSSSTTQRLITTPRQTVTTPTLPPGTGAAPTMGAMLGGGLGMAAGILGVFAM